MTGLYLAMYGDKVTLGQAGFISIFAMIVVFVILLIISYMIDITAFFINKGTAKPKKANGAVTNTASPAPTKKAGGSDTVAVIAAAVAAYMGTSVDNIRICKIRRVGQDTTAWSERGLLAQMNKLK